MLPRSTQRPGAVTTILVLAITGIVISSFVSLSILATSQIGQVGDVEDGDQTFFAAEGGLNHGLFALSTNPGGQTFTTTINGADVTITITVDATDPLGQRRIVTSTASLNGKARTLQVVATTTALAGNLQYAVHSGTGGIDLENNAAIFGNVYANGPITGKNKNAITLNGNAWSAGSDSRIERITVTGDTHAVTQNSVTVNGSQDFTNPATTPFPITPQQVDVFKDTADNTTLTGNVVINGDTTLTARKIVGSLTINSGVLTLDGPVWVTGTIDMKPNITIRLPASLGTGSGVLMSDAVINVENNATLMGSGDPKSFLLVIGLKVDVADPVIIAGNNSVAVIYFAPNGRIEVRPAQGGGLVNNVTAESIHLLNNAQLQYNSSISGFYIQSGPPQPIGVVSGTWKDL